MNNGLQSDQLKKNNLLLEKDISKKINQARLVMIIPFVLTAVSGLAFIYFDQFKTYTDQDLGLSSHYETTLISGSFFLVFALLVIPCLLLGLNDINKAHKSRSN